MFWWNVSSSSIPSDSALVAAASAIVGGAVDLRIEERLRDAGARAHLFDTRDGGAQIEVVGDRVLDQVLQRRIVEHLEPGRVGQRLRLRAFDEAELLRARQLRPLVVGTDEATGRHRRKRDAVR